MSERDFAETIRQAMEDSVVSLIRKGEWIQPDYSSRIKLDVRMLQSVYAGIDMARVLERVREKVEEHVADKILNSMATEVATDVKQVLGNTELREDIRSIIRAKIREAGAALGTATDGADA